MLFSCYFLRILFFLYHYSQFFFFHWFSILFTNKNEYFGLFLYNISSSFILSHLFLTTLSFQSSSPAIQKTRIDFSSLLHALICSNRPFTHSPLSLCVPIFNVSWIYYSFHTHQQENAIPAHTHTFNSKLSPTYFIWEKIFENENIVLHLLILATIYNLLSKQKGLLEGLVSIEIKYWYLCSPLEKTNRDDAVQLEYPVDKIK